MDKKPGQISSNTLSLRFMQNAAKARQEREVEAAKAKVRSEEEWELAPDVRESWRIENKVDDDQTVSYEPSYLPFLFPHADGYARPGGHHRTSEDEDGEVNEESPAIIKGRRRFGKDGKEETEEETLSNPLPPPPQSARHDGSIPARGARSISSHGRAAVAASKPSKRQSQRLATAPEPPPINPPPQNPITGTSVHVPAQGFLKPPIEPPRARGNSQTGSINPPPQNPITGTSVHVPAQGFLKPPIEPPRARGNGQSGSRKKRPAGAGGGSSSYVSIIDDVDDGARTKKKRRE